jgi:hypothetical protein
VCAFAVARKIVSASKIGIGPIKLNSQLSCKKKKKIIGVATASY